MRTTGAGVRFGLWCGRGDGRERSAPGIKGPSSSVDVPRGRLTVTARDDGHVELTRPAVLVAHGQLDCDQGPRHRERLRAAARRRRRARPHRRPRPPALRPPRRHRRRRRAAGGAHRRRTTRRAALPGAAGTRWFMDYRNADGSMAEMCGNGIRVFARYLVDEGLEQPGQHDILTRDGVKTVRLGAEGDVTVDMGPARLPGTDRKVSVGDRAWPAVEVDTGNPHAVVFVDDLGDAGELRSAPVVEPPYPDGVNVEFVVRRGDRHVAMRVHERGVGETRSCGTGACAVMAASAQRDGIAGAVVVRRRRARRPADGDRPRRRPRRADRAGRAGRARRGGPVTDRSHRSARRPRSRRCGESNLASPRLARSAGRREHPAGEGRGGAGRRRRGRGAGRWCSRPRRWAGTSTRASRSARWRRTWRCSRWSATSAEDGEPLLWLEAAEAVLPTCTQAGRLPSCSGRSPMPPTRPAGRCSRPGGPSRSRTTRPAGSSSCCTCCASTVAVRTSAPCAPSGLRPLEAIVAGAGGPGNAAFFGWPEPLPEVTDELRARLARAEEATDAQVAPAYAVLDERAGTTCCGCSGPPPRPPARKADRAPGVNGTTGTPGSVSPWRTMTSAFDDDVATSTEDPPVHARPALPRPTRATTTASSTTSPTARRCAGSPGCRPSSRTSPRSSTASCASSGSCWSASGPRARRRTPRTRWPSWPRWPRPPARRCSRR